MEIKVIKKPDDPLAIRCSIGGSPDVGYYLVYRGDVKEIITMMEITAIKLSSDVLDGVEHPIET